MYIENCLKNVRCDTIGCHKMASFNLQTSSFKGSTSLCENCFSSLFDAMQKVKQKTQNKANLNKKGDKNENRK